MVQRLNLFDWFTGFKKEMFGLVLFIPQTYSYRFLYISDNLKMKLNLLLYCFRYSDNSFVFLNKYGLYICFRYSEKILLEINCIFVSDILKMASVMLLHSVLANKDFKRICVTLLVELPVYVLSIIVTFFSIPILLCNVHQCDPLLLTPCCGLAISR